MNITETIIYLTEDIKNIQEKTWLKPALISHVSKLTKKPKKLILLKYFVFI